MRLFDVSLSGPEGCLETGFCSAGAFGGWSLRPVASGVSELRVTNERLHPYYGTKPLTRVRVRFRPDRLRHGAIVWWEWSDEQARNQVPPVPPPQRVAPSIYRVHGYPEVIDDQLLRKSRQGSPSTARG
jgi:hypothetical protein